MEILDINAQTTTTTFSNPPLDGSLTIPEIYDYHLLHSPKHPFFKIAKEDGSVQTILWEAMVQATYRASSLVESGQLSKGQSDVIAVYANADIVTYFALLAGIMRAGHQAFPICTTFSEAALAHLLVQTNAKTLFVSNDIAMQSAAKSACERISNAGGLPCDILPFPTYESLFNEVDPIVAPRPTPSRSGDMTAAILHSSGSTGLPKPIRLSHLNLLRRACSPRYGEKSLTGQVLWYSVKPVYAWSFVAQYGWTAATGLVISVSEPSVNSSPSLIVKAAVATKTDILLTSPRMLKPLLYNPVHLEALRSFSAVICGGGSLSKDVGDALIKKGVSLITGYGATEFGHVSTFPIAKHRGENWEYFKISPHCRPVFLKQEGSDSIFRIFFANCSSHAPAIFNSKLPDGSDAYDTGDLLLRHPNDPELWKMYGRADDQIVTISSSNINPTPIEKLLCKSPMISRAVVFGHGRLHIGVLLEPADPLVDPVAFLKKISTNIAEVNDFVPTYSRIFDGMVIVADPSRPFLCTQKGGSRRSLILDAYKKEIDEAYDSFEKAAQSSGGLYSVVYAQRHCT